jgi:ribosomal protein S18 acetylase RimI-like enzyme
MNLRIRSATRADFPFLCTLESLAFPDFKRSSPRSIRHGLQSRFQQVLVAEDASGAGPAESGERASHGPTPQSVDKPQSALQPDPVGSAVLFCYPQSLRIYSIAVMPSHRGKGVGDALLRAVFEQARARGNLRVTAEVRANDARLLAWYLSKGFTAGERLSGYYAPDEDALKLSYRL